MLPSRAVLRLRPCLPAVVAWSAVMMVGSPAHAAPEPVRVHIDYQAPPSCPSLEDLFAAVGTRTPIVTPASPSEASRAFRVEVTADSSGARGEIRAAESGREAAVRVVEGATCEEVIDALGLTIALAIDPDALLQPPPPSAERSVQKPARSGEPGQPPAPVKATPVPRSARPAPGRSRGRFGASALVARLLDIGPSLGGRVFGQLGIPATEATVRLTLSMAEARSDHTLFRSALLGLSYCPVRLSLGKLALSPGAELEGGVLRGEGRGFGHSTGASRSWWAAGVLLRSELQVARWLDLEAAAGIALPLVKRRFVVEQPPQPIAETEAPAFWASGGFSVPF